MADKPEVVKIELPSEEPVFIQIGPTPGYAFAIYALNPKYHSYATEHWIACATKALLQWCGRENHALVRSHPEHARPLNMMIEFS